MIVRIAAVNLRNTFVFGVGFISVSALLVDHLDGLACVGALGFASQRNDDHSVCLRASTPAAKP
jgi:hypothetical protein